jgi:uncharacterized protein YhjY with autotransporter beta-barrel domain
MQGDIMQPNSVLSGGATDHSFSQLLAKRWLINLWWALKPWLFVSGFVVLGLLIGNLRPANAEPFGSASNQRLIDICNDPRNKNDFKNPPEFVDPSINITPLGKICTFNGQPSSSTQNSGSQTQATPVLISQQQLRQARAEEEHKTKGGASSDTISMDLGDRFSAFLVAGAGTLRHHQNDFEQGYHSTLPSVTVGGDYRINTKLVLGLAFNYFNQNGDFTSVGGLDSGFDVNSYSPLFYLNYVPFDRAFANVILGYARQNTSYSRFAQVFKDDPVNNKGAEPNSAASATDPRLVSADFHRDLLSAYVQTGYDYPISANGNFTIGPRLGLNVQHLLIDDYQESSNTGLELHYREPDQTSVQTIIGFTVASVFTTSIGIVSPYFTAGWAHEFANAQRTIHASFVQDPAPQEFTFQTENPARNWAILDLGVSLLMSPKLSAFATFSTMQGNANFVSYGGNVGVRGYW